MCFIYWTISFLCLILMTVPENGECWNKEELKLRVMLNDWQNISSTWCQADNFPDETIDDVYECFRLSRGNKEFDLQVTCENKIFPESLSKNEVRKEMCKNDPVIVKNFEDCYAKAGFAVHDYNTAEPEVGFERQEKIKKKYKNFQQLIVCIQAAFGWIQNRESTE